ncbi:MAG: Integrase catalytic region [Acidobacteria bacterium]|nr:Integrase catalytic region [Acidobacteriota bacterium]
MKTDDFACWVRSFDAKTQSLIETIRSSDPARRVQSGERNIIGCYQSKKNGNSIQHESALELAEIQILERDSNVLEYYDQPITIKLEYEGSNGRQQAWMHTPDFFVLNTAGAGFVECKPEENLLKLAEKFPQRYQKDENGQWHCPPAEQYVEAFKLYYRIVSSNDINWTFQRNAHFLQDYYGLTSSFVSAAARKAVLEILAAETNIRLNDLFDKTQGSAARDEVLAMIALGEVFVDLNESPLVEPQNVSVFPNEEAGKAFGSIFEADPPRRSTGPRVVNVSAGGLVRWNGEAFKVVNVGESLVSLLSNDHRFVEMPVSVIEELVARGRLAAAAPDPESQLSLRVREILAGANEADLAEANRRWRLVKCRLKGERLPRDNNMSERTIRWLVSSYKRAESEHGCGYVGLLSNVRKRGCRISRLPQVTWDAIRDFIANDYETHKQKKMFAVWALLREKCQAQNIISPSYRTFSRAVHQSSIYLQTRKRKGRRAAYKYEPFIWALGQQTPRHGDRPFEICHIDHQLMKVVATSSQTNAPLGAPWWTMMLDAFSRRVLGVFVSFDPPSYRSCMMVLRDCVRRYGRFPQTIVVDGGRDFQSTYFDTLLAMYECNKKVRPPAKPRFGSVEERLFGTANTQLVYNLSGNTQIKRERRQITKALDPNSNALWPMGRIYDRLCEYCFDIYDTIEHPALGQSRRDAFAAASESTGFRSHRLVAYDEAFLISTMPTTPKGTAKVQPGRGVKINSILYWSEAFREPSIEMRNIAIRYDPFNAGTAFAFAGNQWVRCHSEYFSTFNGRSERELMLATAELRARFRRHGQQYLTITARKLAEFLDSVEAEEVLLEQRQRDYEIKSILNSINSGGNDQRTSPPAALPVKSTRLEDRRSKTRKVATESAPAIYQEF